MISKARILVFAIVSIALIACAVPAAAQPQFEEFDRSSVEGLPKAERLAAQRAYKERVEAAARAAGWVAKTDTSFKPNGGTVADRAPGRVPGSMIAYHSGATGTCCQTSYSVGNRFDTALTTGATPVPGSVEMSGSITGVSFSMAAVGGGAAFVSFFDQLSAVTPGVANPVSSASRPAVTGLNTLNLTATPVNYVGSTFLAGVWQFTGGGDTPAVATGTVGGQGFHGMSINDISGSTFVALGATNGTISVQGNVATPVELQSFSIE